MGRGAVRAPGSIFCLLLCLVMPALACDMVREGFYRYGLRSRPNILLITVESLRADRVRFDMAPNLAKMAQKGISMTQAQSTSSWALPAVASAFTGLYPPRHGLENAHLKKGALTLDRLNNNHDTLAEILSGYGYATYGFSTNGRMDRLFGFDQGLDRYDCADGGSFRTIATWLDRIGPSLKADGKSETPYFLWLHFSDPRYPYLPRRPYIDELLPSWEQDVQRLVMNDPVLLARNGAFSKDENLTRLVQALYDSEVAATDMAIARLLEKLPGQERLLVTIVGTNGEALGDHGCLGSGDNLQRELIHVPWIFLLPGSAFVSGPVDSPVSPVDLMPTILELADVPCPAQIDGISLVPLLKGQPMPARQVFSTLRRPRQVFRAAFDGRYKRIEKSPAQTLFLFDLLEDPMEKRNRVGEGPEMDGRLALGLAAYAACVPSFPGEQESVRLGFETMEQMRAVGYLR